MPKCGLRVVCAAFVNALLAALVASALIVIQLAISGTRLVFALPAYALLAVCAVMLPAVRQSGREPQKWCLIVVAVFFAYILGRAMQSPVEYLARPDIYMVLACLATYGVTALCFQKSGPRLALLVCIFGLAVVEVMFGVRQFAGEHGWMPFGFLREPTQRASGSFISPIHLAGYLEAVAPFALAIAIWGTQRSWARWLCMYVALLCYIGVVLTASRGGWLASLFSLLVLGVLALIVTYRTDRPRFPGMVYMVILMVVLVPSISYPLMVQSALLKKRLATITNVAALPEGTYDIRQANWAAALEQWKLSKRTGTGAGTHLYYGRLFRRPELQPDPEHAHSDYLELLAEYGIIGAAGMAALLGVHALAGLGGFRRLVRAREDDPYGPRFQLACTIGALTAFSAHAAHAVVDFNMHLPGNAIFLAIIFGFLANTGDEAEPSLEAEEPGEPAPEPPRGLTSKVAAWSVAGIGVWICVIALPKFPGEYWCEKARVAVRNRDYGKAISDGQKALEWENINPFIHLHIGQAHRITAEKTARALRKPHYLTAAESFKEGLKLFPQDEELWVRYAQTLEGLGDFRAAGDAYRQAVNLDPNLGVIRSHYSRFLRKVGREEEADEQAKMAAEASKKNLAPIPVYRNIYEPDNKDEVPAGAIE